MYKFSKSVFYSYLFYLLLYALTDSIRTDSHAFYTLSEYSNVNCVQCWPTGNRNQLKHVWDITISFPLSYAWIFMHVWINNLLNTMHMLHLKYIWS